MTLQKASEPSRPPSNALSSAVGLVIDSAGMPKVTIGMPVYNGERLIRKAIEALLNQTFRDFILVISDNASTDSTGEICVEYAKLDARIRYVRQPENRGAALNFGFVFDHARTEYFMWAACDDLRSEDFLEINLEFLETHPDFVASTSPVRFAGGEFDEIKMGDQSLTGNRFENMIAFFETWHANGRFYSLFRRNAVSGWKHLGENFLGSDWALIIHLIGLGKFNRSGRGWVTLGTEGASSRRGIFASSRRTFLDWPLPFNRLSTYVLSKLAGASCSQKFEIGRRLIRLNRWAFREQFRTSRIR